VGELVRSPSHIANPPWLCLTKTWQHVPHLNDMNSFMGILAISALGIFMNLLDLDTYCLPGHRGWQIYADEDILRLGHSNAMSVADRAACSLARGMSLSLHGWIQANIKISNAKHEVINMNSFIITYIANNLYGIWCYKVSSPCHLTLGAPNCTPFAFCAIGEKTFLKGNTITASVADMAREGREMPYASCDVYNHRIHRLPVPVNKPWSVSTKMLMKMGTQNLLDMGFYDEDLFAEVEGAVSDLWL